MLIGLIPVFNEEKKIIEVLNRLERNVAHIVIVNDGSFDKTEFFISEWIKERPNVTYLSFKKNKGMSHALKQGFVYISEQYQEGKFSQDNVVVTIDGDGQHDPYKIKEMFGYFNKNNLDVLIGKRDFLNYPRYRIVGNRFISFIASYLGKFRFKDIECGFKMLKVTLVGDLLHYYIGIRYSCACEIGMITSLLGYKIDNSYPIEVSYYRRRGPRFIDLLINVIFCLVVVPKVKFDEKMQWHKKIC